MEKDVHRFLRDLGYLKDPATRFFWKNVTPTLRGHLRQFLMLALWCSTPTAMLLASISHLRGFDRIGLFFFYSLAMILFLAALDLCFGWLVRRRGLDALWSKSRWINALPLPLGICFLMFAAMNLANLISAQPASAHIPIWVALVLWSWMMARGCALLLISRLYWHGVRLPEMHRYPLFFILILTALWIWRFGGEPPSRLPFEGPRVELPPLVLLAFDMPEPWFEPFADSLPAWTEREFWADETDITRFWAGFGMGTSAHRGQTSLLTFKTPFFREPLNRDDPTQWLPLQLFRWMNLAEPSASGGRYRKYFWEILDEYGLRTYAYAFWHSFPAASQNGGVLSERWSSARSEPPYLHGLVTQDSASGLPETGPALLIPTIQRENQSWAQLQIRAQMADFDICVAYFPLGDQFRMLDAERQNVRQTALMAFRRRVLGDLLKKLPAKTRIGILIASGRPIGKEKRIRVRFFSTGLDSLDHPLEGHLEIAPAILHAYGLPIDRLMVVPSFLGDAAGLPKKWDYGEPARRRLPYLKLDSHYYEVLKSLGYIQ